MPQPKSSPAEVSMPTFAPLEEWTRSQVQELMQSVLEEEVTHVLGRARYERQALLDAPRGHRNGYGKPRSRLVQGTKYYKQPSPFRGFRFNSSLVILSDRAECAVFRPLHVGIADILCSMIFFQPESPAPFVWGQSPDR